MILFYDKITGDITGTIDGRIHDKSQMNMWIGDKDKTERLIVSWKAVNFYNEKGEVVDPKSDKVFTADYEPDHTQKDLFCEIDKKSVLVYEYRVDPQTKLLIKK